MHREGPSCIPGEDKFPSSALGPDRPATIFRPKDQPSRNEGGKSRGLIVLVGRSLDCDDGGSIFLRNVTELLQDCTTSHRTVHYSLGLRTQIKIKYPVF